MASPSILSQTMRSISLTKIRELEKQRSRYESRKNEVLSAAEQHPNNIRERITQLLRGVKKLCEADLTDDSRVKNIYLWLQQSSYDPSVPFQMLQSYEVLLRSKLEVQSRKLSIGYLWSRLVTEWMESSTPMSEAPDSEDESSDMDRQEKHLRELCDKFEKVVFTPLETDEARIEEYLQDLFSGDEVGKALSTLRRHIRKNELNSEEPFDRDTLRWCVNGLLAEDLLSDEKQNILREFLETPVVLDEIADVLNLRIADFDNWSWEAGEQGIPVLPRQQLNGKYRIWMDEDVLQAIFIHYIGIKNCVELKRALTKFLDSPEAAWNWTAGRDIPSIDGVRYEYFTGARLGDNSTVKGMRSDLYRNSFFLSQLPTSVTTIGKIRAYANDGAAQEDEDSDEQGKQRDEKADENVNIKQRLLRTLATEAIVSRTLYGEAAVVQSDLQWYATGLPHSTIFTVMRFLGFSERMVSFYRKVLQAPLNMVSTPGELPTGEPRIRQRGVPMAHAPEKLIGEMILFIMDLAVNKATGMLLYRLHDDLFLSGEPLRCAQAWKEMKTFADIMGVEFNKNKTGSVYLTSPENSRDPETEATLPEGPVRIGHLLLDGDSGEWVLDQGQIDEHVAQLRKQLAACNNVMDWVKTWNSCIGRFFSHTLGEPAYCFGLKHVDSVLQTYQRIQGVLFKPTSQSATGEESQPSLEGNVVDYLKSKIEERFGVSDIPDAFIFLPERMGGLGVKNPFIPYLAFRNQFLTSEDESSPDTIMRKFLADEKESYEGMRKSMAKLDSTEDRLRRVQMIYTGEFRAEFARIILDKALTPGAGDDFWSFEEYTRHRESTSHLLGMAYSKLLKVPDQKGADVDRVVTRALSSDGIKDLQDPRVLQIKWVLQLYQDELKERWGGFRLVDEKYLPLGLLAMMRRKAVQWTMVLLSSIPIADNTTTTDTISDKPSGQHTNTVPSTNPFRLIPPAYRPLLTTLHVLYPSTLLPALDLLDRRLVTRVILKQDATHTQHPTAIQTDRCHIINPDQGDLDIAVKTESTITPPLYHLVRSAQPHSHRRQQTTSSGGQTYIVRLESWNCTCAAFAFSAFPPLPSPSPAFSSTPRSTAGGYQIFPTTTPREEASPEDTEPFGSRENVDRPWEFGGLSTDGVDGAGSVPCCKHLLACVLAEKWNAALGGYIEQRSVSREEAAGLVGDL
ncbi:hypothetical protein O1611_g1177 [Lasiodiplodia mahajangana]|uniref:Uncharacterized protein n=1 Tax=Lasiodiplodia mahajangana TaxID=1108764 RepID=A0ACC2JYV7_9PEZI|nr:hypothetical protein O1611_g1177 [Lasiodiplodia mahajangana]